MVPKARRIISRAKNRLASLNPQSRQARLLEIFRNQKNPLPARIPYKLSAEEQKFAIALVRERKSNVFKQRLTAIEHFLRMPSARLERQLKRKEGKMALIELFSFIDPYGAKNAKKAENAINTSDIKSLREAMLAEHSRLLASSLAVELQNANSRNSR